MNAAIPPPVPITSAQCRAARALIRWGIARLAEASGVSETTVNVFELDRRTPHPNNLAAIRAALEAAGVEFTAETDAVGPGVRLKKNASPAQRSPVEPLPEIS